MTVEIVEEVPHVVGPERDHTFPAPLVVDDDPPLPAVHIAQPEVAEFRMLEIALRLTLHPITEKYFIRSPFDAAMLVMPEMAFLDNERCVLVLDTMNYVTALSLFEVS